MAEVLLYHHVQGLTDGVKACADQLRGAGHTVHTPDLFDGHTFPTIDDGMTHAREVGFESLGERGLAAAEGLPRELVYAGFSMGVMVAQQLAQTRPGAKGALFFHSCLPIAEFGEWPEGVPVQVHAMDGDPWFTEEDGDLAAAQALVESVDKAELFLYPGEAHLFADSSLAEYDAAATELLMTRVLKFLAAV